MYFHTLCVQTAKALARLHGSACLRVMIPLNLTSRMGARVDVDGCTNRQTNKRMESYTPILLHAGNVSNIK